jgi:glycosyltransferase involved in cell wall biosynthesis
MAAPLPALSKPARQGRVSHYTLAEGGFPLPSHKEQRRSLIVLIPAHNEQTTVAQVVRAVKETLACEVVVIDDASTDATAQVAWAAGATLLPLSLRLGAWGAIQTGLRYALRKGYRSAVTMDADGQHHAAQIRSLLKPLIAGEADVVIGACPERVSRARRLAWSYFRLLTGLSLEDITSGFRAYNHSAIELLASAEASLLDYQDIGVLLIIRHRNLRTVEVPVLMDARTTGISRVFSSWLIVARYLLQTSLMCIARVYQRSVDKEFSD